MKKKIYIILSLVLLICGVGGYFIFSTMSSNKKEEDYNLKLTSTIKQLETAKSNSAIMASTFQEYWGRSIKHNITSKSIESDLGLPLEKYESLLTFSNSDFDYSGRQIKRGEFNTVLKIVNMAKKNDISDLNTEHSEISKLVSELKNPPEKYAKQYDALLEIFEQYTNFNSLAVSPTGSYIEYSKSINSLYESLSSKLDTIKLQLD